MTPSELKYQIEQSGHEPHFFTRKTMKFFGDTMRNYGVRTATIRTEYNGIGEYVPGGLEVEVWELFRKRTVKHGLHCSAYFAKDTFRRVFARSSSERAA